MQGADVEFRPLPAAMAKPDTLLSSLALFEDDIGLVSTATDLAVYFQLHIEALTTPQLLQEDF